MEAVGVVDDDVIVGSDAAQLSGIVDVVEENGVDPIRGEHVRLVLTADKGRDSERLDGRV